MSGNAQLLTSAVCPVLANSTSNSSWLKGVWSVVSVCMASNQTQAEAHVFMVPAAAVSMDLDAGNWAK